MSHWQMAVVSCHMVAEVAFRVAVVVPSWKVAEVVVLQVEPHFEMAPQLDWRVVNTTPRNHLPVLYNHDYFIIQEIYIVSFKTQWLHTKARAVLMFSYRAVNTVMFFQIFLNLLQDCVVYKRRASDVRQRLAPFVNGTPLQRLSRNGIRHI